jgi:hypothetical protein
MSAKEIQILFQKDASLRLTPTGIVTNTDVGHPVFTPEELASENRLRKKIYNYTDGNGVDRYIRVLYNGARTNNNETRDFSVIGEQFFWNVRYIKHLNDLILILITADSRDEWMTHYSTTILKEQL